nr:hypothetical protein [Clostridia bacterium]
PDKQIADSFIKLLVSGSTTVKTFLSDEFYLGDTLTDDNRVYLSGIRDVIRRFVEGLKNKSTAGDYTKRIRSFLADANTDENIKSIQNRLDSLGVNEEMAFLTSATLKFYAILDEIDFVLADEEITLDDFYKLLVAGEKSCNITIIPQKKDCVYVAELKDCRYKQYKVLFCIGLNGNVPAVKNDTAILSDGDINDLEDLHVKIEPKIKVVNRREKEAVGLTLSCFSEKLFLSYSLVSSSGKQSAKSDVINYIERVFSSEDKKVDKTNKLTEEQDYLAVGENGKIFLPEYSTARTALLRLINRSEGYKNGTYKSLDEANAIYGALKRYGNGQNDCFPIAERLINELTADDMIRRNIQPSNYFNDGKVSASAIECYYSCPYKCFLKYGLGTADK